MLFPENYSIHKYFQNVIFHLAFRISINFQVFLLFPNFTLIFSKPEQNLFFRDNGFNDVES